MGGPADRRAAETGRVVNERQEYALLNPLSSAALDRASVDRISAYRKIRKDKRSGLLLMSILAVDR